VEAVDQDASFARVARRLGANTLLSGTLQRENERFRITYRLVDGSGNQIAANAVDGSEIFTLQDRVADGVVRDLRLRRATRRTPTPSGLETTSEQERYLKAIGFLQRYDRREGVEEAVRVLRKLAEEKPNSALVQAALARASLAMFDFTKDQRWAERAIAASESAHGLDPTLAEVDITLGQIYIATGKPKQASEAFRRALASGTDKVEALIGLGRAVEADGDRSAADVAFRRAIELQPSFAVFNQLGTVYYERGRWAAAAEMFRRATEVAPDSYRAFGNLGGAETMRCNFTAALAAFERALQLHPRDPYASSNLGMTQLWTGKTGEAVASLERAVREAPSDYAVWGNLGDAYRARAGSSAEARDAYERSIRLAREQLRLNPADAEAHSFLATGLAKTGHLEEAEKEIRQAIALAEKDPNQLADAAVIAALAGRDSDALGWLRKAVAAGYCRAIILRQPEFASLHDNSEFRSIIAAPRGAAG
jgi:eukaryotic-like serine/threonine-protein kinase